jgi:predicted DNA-binding transcriptional regulator YafY
MSAKRSVCGRGYPIALGFMNEARVLVAWCELRQDYRMFRTDRIASAQEMGERYPGGRSVLLRDWRAQMNRVEAEGDPFAPDKSR